MNAGAEREALRGFMLANRLRATEWAKSAKVPVNEIYAFLNGRAHSLAPETCERLARAARTSVASMLGRAER
jgi:plasmid maintenance system antidote protein VapI